MPSLVAKRCRPAAGLQNLRTYGAPSACSAVAEGHRFSQARRLTCPWRLAALMHHLFTKDNFLPSAPGGILLLSRARAGGLCHFEQRLDSRAHAYPPNTARSFRIRRANRSVRRNESLPPRSSARAFQEQSTLRGCFGATWKRNHLRCCAPTGK